MDLLSWTPPDYPREPGWKHTDTSRDAAEAIKPSTGYLREKVLSFLSQYGPSTSREISIGLGIDYASIQPRTSELRRLQKIKDSGERRADSKTGKRVIVWAVRG